MDMSHSQGGGVINKAAFGLTFGKSSQSCRSGSVSGQLQAALPELCRGRPGRQTTAARVTFPGQGQLSGIATGLHR